LSVMKCFSFLICSKCCWSDEATENRLRASYNTLRENTKFLKSYTTLVTETKARRTLKILKDICWNNIKMKLTESGFRSEDSIQLAQNWVQWRVVVNKGMNLSIISWPAE
jgi:hypothetical protein